MNLFARLKEERERLGYNQTDFAALAGASKHAQINWEKGAAAPNAAALGAWAGVGLDVLYVVTGERTDALPPGLSAEEQLLLEAYRALPVGRRKAVLAELITGASARPTARKAPTGMVVTGNNNRSAGGNYSEKK